MQEPRKEKFELDLYRNLEERLIDSITSKSYEVYEEDSLDGDGENLSWELYGPSYEEGAFPLIDEEDVAIILEREAHFSGNFPLMIEYYSNDENKGINEEISLHRILKLHEIEKALAKDGKNLAALLLQGRDAEHLQLAKKAYKTLSEIHHYQDQEGEASRPEKNHPAVILAECILSEEPIDVLVDRFKDVFKGSEKLLYTLISSHSFYDRLFPGYGLAPLFAIKTLGKLKDAHAVPILFDQLFRYNESREDVDEEILTALRSIGDPVKKKALSLALDSMWSVDKEKALHILIEFLPDTSISEAILDHLIRSSCRLSTSFLQYAILLLESLPDQRINDLKDWTEREKENLSRDEKEEIDRIIHFLSKREK